MADPSNGRGALAAGGLAAILASTCCLGPLVLITLGFSGAWIGNLTALEPYRPISSLAWRSWRCSSRGVASSGRLAPARRTTHAPCPRCGRPTR